MLALFLGVYALDNIWRDRNTKLSTACKSGNFRLLSTCKLWYVGQLASCVGNLVIGSSRLGTGTRAPKIEYISVSTAFSLPA